MNVTQEIYSYVVKLLQIHNAKYVVEKHTNVINVIQDGKNSKFHLKNILIQTNIYSQSSLVGKLPPSLLTLIWF